MKNFIFIILFLLSLLVIFGLAGTNELQSEELIMIKQLYNIQEDMLQDNFSQQELDSLYLDYNYKYLHEYYQNNYK